MTSGRVKTWLGNKGFGFIVPDDGGPDVFVHVSELERSGIDSLTVGQRLEFLTEHNPRGLRAVDVRVIG